MIKRSAVAAMAILLVTALLLAHGAPLLGTVSAMDKDSITIKDKTGKSIVVMMDKDTKYLKDKKAAAMSDLHVGDRVSIDAHMDEKTKKYSAEEITIGVSASTDAKAAAPAKATKKP